jgi:hypothetical protein
MIKRLPAIAIACVMTGFSVELAALAILGPHQNIIDWMFVVFVCLIDCALICSAIIAIYAAITGKDPLDF